MLGTCAKSVTSQEETILHIEEIPESVLEIIDNIKQSLLENNPANKVIKLEKRLARLTGKIALVKVFCW